MEQISHSSSERHFTPEEVEDLLKSKCAQEQFYSLALFDILGFSNFVEKNGNQVVLDLYQKLLNLIYKYDRGNDPGVAVPNRLTDDWKQGIYIANASGYISVCHFSDTFIIYTSYLFHKPAYWLATPHFEPYPLLYGETGTPYCPAIYDMHPIYLSFLQICMDFFCEATISGIPLRGCVSSGFATMDSYKSIFFGKPLVEAARGEPARKALGISFGKSFNNYHPVYNEYCIPFWDYIKENDPKAKFLSPMVLDWPRRWRESPSFKMHSFVECINRMNTEPAYSEYYDNAICLYNFSSEHKNWPDEIDRKGIKDILDYYQRTQKWYKSAIRHLSN